MAKEDPPIMQPGDIDSDNTQTLDGALEGSWMAQVAEEHEKATEVDELHMGFPSWGPPEFPTLVVTFGVIKKPRLEKYQRDARKAQRKGDSSANSDILFLCEAARKVWVRRPDTEELVQVLKNGQAVRLDKNLGEMLALAADVNANSHVRMMHLAKDNDTALGAWAVKVATWMTNTSANVADQVLEDILIKG
jgi:hypothetical protein